MVCSVFLFGYGSEAFVIAFFLRLILQSFQKIKVKPTESVESKNKFFKKLTNESKSYNYRTRGRDSSRCNFVTAPGIGEYVEHITDHFSLPVTKLIFCSFQ